MAGRRPDHQARHLNLLRLGDQAPDLPNISCRIPVIAPALLGIVLWVLDGGEDPGRHRRRYAVPLEDACARHNGTAPLPAWSSNKARHRLSRTGNRQLNAALHRIALTHARPARGNS